MLANRRIVLGVTGGIAAYKAVFLLREFQKAGADVRVTLTPSATRFVGLETFRALSRQEVPVHVFNDDGMSDNWSKHIQWSEWAEIIVIAPCTANTLAKIVHGFSDNMLTSVVMAARCPVLLCPTMDGGMFKSPAVNNNLEMANKMGFHVLEPDSGYLASGLNDIGRLPEADIIINKMGDILNQKKRGPLSGKKVLVTAGPTREHIDPVRYISNPSSGKMGIAMAEAAHEAGGDVTLIHGPVNATIPGYISSIQVTSAFEMFEAVKGHSDADVIIKSAAVSDFTPVKKHSEKVKKENSDSSIELKKTDDILSWLGKNKKNDQILIGFAMETSDLRAEATRKLKSKNLDWIAANSISEKNSAFGSDLNEILLMNLKSERLISGSKTDIAKEMIRHIFGQ